MLRSGPYRVYFFSDDAGEPPHVHVDRDGRTAKFWINPVDLVSNRGFSGRELRRIGRILGGHEGQLLEAWHEHFGR